MDHYCTHRTVLRITRSILENCQHNWVQSNRKIRTGEGVHYLQTPLCHRYPVLRRHHHCQKDESAGMFETSPSTCGINVSHQEYTPMPEALTLIASWKAEVHSESRPDLISSKLCAVDNACALDRRCTWRLTRRRKQWRAIVGCQRIFKHQNSAFKKVVENNIIFGKKTRRRLLS